MPYFVISGKPDCPNFAHAIYVAEYLQSHLPHFTVRIIRKKPKAWQKLLHHINKVNKWNHTASPIIWKELCRRGGKAHLIGGISEFWEYVDDYYGLQSKLSKEELEDLVKENMESFRLAQEALKDNIFSFKNVIITGAKNRMIHTLLPELTKLKAFERANYYLHDRDPNFFFSDYMEEAMEDLSILCPTVTVIETLSAALTYCHVLIIIEDMTPKPNEEMNSWIARNISLMNHIADCINEFAQKFLKVIICQDGPSCLNATLLCDECHYAKSKNIVAVTSDLGLAPLSRVCKEANINLEDVGAPPVWGFIGLNKFVDVGRAVMRCDIYRPYDRAMRSRPGSSLPLGTIRTEFRFLNFITDDLEENVYIDPMSMTTMAKECGNSSPYAKTRALIGMLKTWYGEDGCENDVISLGIRSDSEVFGVPLGMVFSQPCKFEEGYFRPCSNFPVPPHIQRTLNSLIKPAEILMEEFSIGPSIRQSIYDINI